MTGHVRRGRGGGSKLGITQTTIQVNLEHQSEPRTTRKARPCRITIGVDVSGSMIHLIDAVIGGIRKINGVLEQDDLISIVDFAENISTIFPYLSPTRVNWPDLNRTLRSHVQRSNRGCLTALWDAIGHIIDTTPRNTALLQYKPELVIFTDGQDNASRKYTSESIQALLRKTGIGHVHITIIDASPRGNQTLRDICEPIEHCTFTKVQASQEAVQRAFMDVVSAISKRLTITIQSNRANVNVGSLVNQLTQLGLGVQTTGTANVPRTSSTPQPKRGGNSRRGGRARVVEVRKDSGTANTSSRTAGSGVVSATASVSVMATQIPIAQDPAVKRGARAGRSRKRGRGQSSENGN